MNDVLEPRRLNPWPFVISDLVLVAAAFAIAMKTPAPMSGLSLVSVVLCVALGAVALAIPFVVNYVHRQELYLAERQREIAALAQTTASSAEQISIAVGSLPQISEGAVKAVRTVEQLPQRLQEKINEFKSQLNEVAVTENEALAQELNALRSSETERLEAAVDRIQKFATDLAAREQALRAMIAAWEKSTAAWEGRWDKAVEARLSQFQSQMEGLVAKIPTAPDRTEPVSTTAPEPGPVANASGPGAVEPVAQADLDGAPQGVPQMPVPSSPSPVATPRAVADPTPPAVAFIPAKEPAPRKRRENLDTSPGLDLGLELEPVGDESPQESTPAISADGATRLVVTAYIGIGNKLFARGDGPGLNWEKGVPLQFVSIGKWRWETDEANGPLTVKLLKNDQEPATNLGTITLIPGHQHEVKANF